MKSNFVVLLGFILICLMNLPAKKGEHAVPAPAPAPAPVPLPAPLKMNQANDVDLRAAVIRVPQKLSDDN